MRQFEDWEIEILKELQKLYDDDIREGRDLATGRFIEEIIRRWACNPEISFVDFANFYLRELAKLDQHEVA